MYVVIRHSLTTERQSHIWPQHPSAAGVPWHRAGRDGCNTWNQAWGFRGREGSGAVLIGEDRQRNPVVGPEASRSTARPWPCILTHGASTSGPRRDEAASGDRRTRMRDVP
jgi:hypothetical protein